MKQSILPILLSGLLLIFCSRNQKSRPDANLTRDNEQITKLVFYASVEPNSIYKKLLLDFNQVNVKTLRFLFKNKNERIKYAKQQEAHLDSLKKLLDTGRAYVLITDTLVPMERNYFQQKLIEVNIAKKRTSADTSLFAWWKKIALYTKSDEFYLKNLKFRYMYHYLYESKRKTIKGNALIAGIFSMSPIYYNKNKDKAFVYTSFICGSLCGDGKDFYLEKKNGRWFIFVKIRAWVS